MVGRSCLGFHDYKGFLMVFVKVQADVLEYIGTGHGQDREYGGWHVFSCDEKLEDQGYFGKVVWTTWFSVF